MKQIVFHNDAYQAQFNDAVDVLGQYDPYLFSRDRQAQNWDMARRGYAMGLAVCLLRTQATIEEIV